MKNAIKYYLFYLLSVFLFGVTALNASEIEITERLNDYVPSGIKLINESGDTVDFLTEINKPTVVNFVYFNCPGICTPLLNEIQSIIEKSDLILGTDYQFMTISFDVKETTDLAVKKKSNYLKTMQKSEEVRIGWKFYTADSLNIAKATQSVGYGFKPVGSEFIHKAAMIFINDQGKIIRYNLGIDLLPSELQITIIEANNGNALPKTYKNDEYCFPYVAPAYQRLNNIARQFGYLTIGLALIFFLYLVIKPRFAKN